MAEKEDFVSLEKALKELRLKEEELKRLVSDGEIRAFRDADKMKFKREDIERLKQDTGKTIQFNDESSDTLTDDLLFDEEVEDLDISNDVGMATAPISSDETFIEDKKGGKGKTSGKTPPKDAGKSQKTQKSQSVKATMDAEATAERGKTTSIRRTTGRSTRLKVEAEVRKTQIHPAIAAVLVVSAMVLMFTCLIWWDITNGQMTGATRGVSDSVANMFLGEEK